LKPGPIPLAKASSDRIPRQEEVEHVLAGQATRHSQVLQQRREQRQVQDGSREPHDQPDRVAQQLGDVPLEQQPDIPCGPHLVISFWPDLITP
jgi:hypothetical protein